MTRFDECLKFILKWEGGYVHHPHDRGGATNQGITQGVYDAWRVGKSMGRQPVVGLSGAERDAIYRERYWQPVRCDRLPQPVDLVVFDSAVNCGVSQAAKWLQRAVGVKADGVIGPVTLAAVAQHEPVWIAGEILTQRADFYDMLITRNPTQAVFARGWTNRIDDLRREVA